MYTYGGAKELASDLEKKKKRTETAAMHLKAPFILYLSVAHAVTCCNLFRKARLVAPLPVPGCCTTALPKVQQFRPEDRTHEHRPN